MIANLQNELLRAVEDGVISDHIKLVIDTVINTPNEKMNYPILRKVDYNKVTMAVTKYNHHYLDTKKVCQIYVLLVCTEQQQADILRKAFPKNTFLKLCGDIG